MERKRAALGRRTADLVAMGLIGDGMLAAVAPRRHSALWRVGPLAKPMSALHDRPLLARVLGAAVVGAGFLLAFKQYGKD